MEISNHARPTEAECTIRSCVSDPATKPTLKPQEFVQSRVSGKWNFSGPGKLRDSATKLHKGRAASVSTGRHCNPKEPCFARAEPRVEKFPNAQLATVEAVRMNDVGGRRHGRDQVSAGVGKTPQAAEDKEETSDNVQVATPSRPQTPAYLDRGMFERVPRVDQPAIGQPEIHFARVLLADHGAALTNHICGHLGHTGPTAAGVQLIVDGSACIAGRQFTHVVAEANQNRTVDVVVPHGQEKTVDRNAMLLRMYRLGVAPGSDHQPVPPAKGYQLARVDKVVDERAGAPTLPPRSSGQHLFLTSL